MTEVAKVSFCGPDAYPQCQCNLEAMPIKFSRSEYVELVSRVRSELRSPHEVVEEQPQAWSVLRHDIEFSLKRAVRVAEWDFELGVRSVFFLQVQSMSYNAHDSVAKETLERIKNLGHEVGLHLYLDRSRELSTTGIADEVSRQSDVLERAASGPVTAFSAHRPPHWFLRVREDFFAGRLNMYGPSLFEFTESPTRINYCSDSRHRFDFVQPSQVVAGRRNHLLLHPDEWSEHGLGVEENFQDLYEEARSKVIHNFEREASHFRKGYLGD